MSTTTAPFTPPSVATVAQIPGLDVWTVVGAGHVTTSACYPTRQDAQDRADLLNRCWIANTGERSAYSLQRGDVTSDGMGTYYLVVEAATVSDTWDSHPIVWTRTRIVAGLDVGATRSFRYEQDDMVLTVNR